MGSVGLDWAAADGLAGKKSLGTGDAAGLGKVLYLHEEHWVPGASPTHGRVPVPCIILTTPYFVRCKSLRSLHFRRHGVYDVLSTVRRYTCRSIVWAREVCLMGFLFDNGWLKSKPRCPSGHFPSSFVLSLTGSSRHLPLW